MRCQWSQLTSAYVLSISINQWSHPMISVMTGLWWWSYLLMILFWCCIWQWFQFISLIWFRLLHFCFAAYETIILSNWDHHHNRSYMHLSHCPNISHLISFWLLIMMVSLAYDDGLSCIWWWSHLYMMMVSLVYDNGLTCIWWWSHLLMIMVSISLDHGLICL